MSLRYWVFGEENLEKALRDWTARLEHENKRPTSVAQAIRDFLNSPEAAEHKMIG